MNPEPENATILIVDDNSSNIRTIVEYLDVYGFETIIARDGEMGLRRAELARPDLILLDVMMPGINGFETCRQLKENKQTQGIPVIFMTALSGIEDKMKGFEAGGVDYITKPVQREEALARVTTHLQLRAQTKRLQQQAHDLKQANEHLKQEMAERRKAEAALQRAHDELEQRVAERTAQLAKANLRLAEAQRMAHLGNWEWNIVNNTVHWSDEVYRIFGMNPQQTEVTYEGFLNSVHPVDRKFVKQTVRSTLSQKIPYNIEHRIVLPDAAVRFVHIQGKPVTDETGQIIRLVGTVQDITERRSLEEQLRQAQKMEAVGRLTGGVAHDFNNFLTVIFGNCSFMLRELEPEHLLRRDVKQIQNAAERAAALTRQLLAFSRQQILKPEILNLNSVVSNIEKMLHRLIGEDINMDTMYQPQLGPVQVDPGQIEQVIMNLAVNARDAMPNGGKLTIETANIYLDEAYALRHADVTVGWYVMLAVSDTGAGMDAKTRARIFDPFFTTKDVGKGTGLGLSTVHGIVKQSQGHIWVYSELGKGTTFKIYFPQAALTKSVAQQNRRPQAKYRQRALDILALEDDEVIRDLLERTLKDAGHTVFVAKDGSQARQICAQQKPALDLLITDVIIPGGESGPQVAKYLASIYPKMKVLYISGYTSNAIVHRGILDSDINFLPKPFMPDALLRKIYEVLDMEMSDNQESAVE